MARKSFEIFFTRPYGYKIPWSVRVRVLDGDPGPNVPIGVGSYKRIRADGALPSGEGSVSVLVTLGCPPEIYDPNFSGCEFERDELAGMAVEAAKVRMGERHFGASYESGWSYDQEGDLSLPLPESSSSEA